MFQFNPRYRPGTILFFAVVGISLAGISMFQLQRSNTIPLQKTNVPALPTVKTDGGSLNAFLRAREALMCEPDVPPAQKEITQYSVEIVQGALFYKVRFETQQIKIDYWISKATGRLTRSR